MKKSVLKTGVVALFIALLMGSCTDAEIAKDDLNK